MIASITEWVKGIILVVLFASFLELLLPSNSMQKFIRVILGLFIMLAILQPVIGVLEKTWTQEQLPVLAGLSGNKLTDTEILNAASHAAGRREQLARDIYTRDLSRQIRATILAIDGVADAKVTIAFEENNQQETKAVGKIKQVLVFIKAGATTDERKIAKIAISPSEAAEKKPASLSAEIIDKANRAVAELYQLKISQIIIKPMD
jgi:stage III sporulation protein AF